MFLGAASVSAVARNDVWGPDNPAVWDMLWERYWSAARDLLRYVDPPSVLEWVDAGTRAVGWGTGTCLFARFATRDDKSVMVMKTRDGTVALRAIVYEAMLRRYGERGDGQGQGQGHGEGQGQGQGRGLIEGQGETDGVVGGDAVVIIE